MNLAFETDQLEMLIGQGFGYVLALEGSSFFGKYLGGENKDLIFVLKNKEDHSEGRCLNSETMFCHLGGKGLT